MHSKSQISAEFLILAGFSLFIAVAFAIASLDQLSDFRLQKENEAIKDVALKLQRELLMASTVEDGYIRTFSIPDKINEINYTLTTLNSTITVKSKNSLYTVAIPKIVGRLGKGSNTINKTGGVIYVSSESPSTFSDFSVCQNAQSTNSCLSLDATYGTGYKSACCSEHDFCCT